MSYLDMLPGFSRYDARHRCPRGLKTNSNIFLLDTVTSKVSNIVDNCIGEICHRVRLTVAMSFLVHFVHDIFGVRPKKKMGRIDAQFHVATVKNTKTFWNWTNGQFPRYSVCSNHLLPPATPPDGSVSRSDSPGPEPTGIGFFNFLKKPFANWDSLIIHCYREVDAT